MRVLARIDLKGCPEGPIFRPDVPVRTVERKYFAGWENPLGRGASQWSVLYDEGRAVLAQCSNSTGTFDQCLVTGDFLWADYSVEARIRQMPGIAIGHSPDLEFEPTFNSGRRHPVYESGLVARLRDVRHSYFYGIREWTKLVLYRRSDLEFADLAAVDFLCDPKRYYHLKMEVQEKRIACYVDGKLAFEVQDDAYPTGKAGIRSCAECRYDEVRVTSSEQAYGFYIARRKAEEEELEKLKERYPKPVLWREIGMGAYGSRSLKFGRIGGAPGIFVAQAGDSGVTCLTALNLKGEIIWQRGEPDPSSSGAAEFQVGDIDGDGADDVVCVWDGALVVLDGKTGEEVASRPLPYGSRREGYDFRRIPRPGHIYLGHFLEPGGRRQILVKGPQYRGAWLFDSDLSEIWSKPDIWFGHHLAVYDMDGDGREEAIVGYQVVNAEGEVLFAMERSEFLTQPFHVDCMTPGPISGDPEEPPMVAMACGPLGYVLMDGKGKIVAQDPLGHAQTLMTGNYRPDLPGLETWVCTRWGNYGIRALYSSRGERLFTFQPDYGENAGPPVNWSGDGEELALHWTSPQCFGLFDAYGRKVVEIPDIDPAGGWTARAQDLVGDPRDELIFWNERTIRIYTQEGPFEGERIYAPIRRWYQQSGGYLSEPAWKER